MISIYSKSYNNHNQFRKKKKKLSKTAVLTIKMNVALEKDSISTKLMHTQHSTSGKPWFQTALKHVIKLHQ